MKLVVKFGPGKRETNRRPNHRRRRADRGRNRGRWLRAMAHPDESTRSRAWNVDSRENGKASCALMEVRENIRPVRDIPRRFSD